jgi:hypothetical protein
MADLKQIMDKKSNDPGACFFIFGKQSGQTQCKPGMTEAQIETIASQKSREIMVPEQYRKQFELGFIDGGKLAKPVVTYTYNSRGRRK